MGQIPRYMCQILQVVLPKILSLGLMWEKRISLPTPSHQSQNVSKGSCEALHIFLKKFLSKTIPLADFSNILNIHMVSDDEPVF